MSCSALEGITCWSLWELPYSVESWPLILHLRLLQIFPNMPTIHYTLAKWIIAIACMCSLFFTSVFLLIPSAGIPLPHLLTSHLFFKVLLLRWPVSLENFHGLFSAHSTAPSFLCYILPVLHISSYFRTSVIPFYVVRKEAVFYSDALLSWYTPLP